MSTDTFILLDFRESEKILRASNTIKKWFSEMAHCVIMLSVQAECNTIEEAEEMIVVLAKRTILICNLHGKNKMGVNRLNEIFCK